MKWLQSVIFFIVTAHLYVHGQNISIDTSTYSIDELVRDVLIQSECAEIANVNLIGNNAQIGYFSNGGSAIGVQKGIILSTGRASEARGPNQRTGTGNWLDFFDAAHVGDEDLRRAANVNVNQVKDDAILEFDFVPLENHIEFEFVFASEEYCDYAGANVQFNDVFGFFLSGPGINGPYSNDAINIGVTPDGSSNITVKNINHNVNYDYFIDNTPKDQPLALAEHYENCRLDVPRDGISSLMERDGSSIMNLEYDGYTVIMRAESSVTPFEQYHLKIAIADIIDGGWDSAVFLKAGSFRAGQPKAVIAEADSLDCRNPSIMLDGSNSSRGATYSYQWETDDGHIVSGDQTFTPTVDQAGSYRLIVSRVGSNCADTAYVDVVYNDEKPEILGANSLAIQCHRPSVDIAIEIANPDLYTYQLEYPTGTFSSISSTPIISTTHAGWHIIHVMAANGCEDYENHFVEIDTFSGNAIFEGYEFTCRDIELIITPSFEDQLDPFLFNWSTSNGNILSAVDNLELTIGSAGLYELWAQNETNGCEHTFYVDIVSNEIPPTISAGEDEQLDCRFRQVIPNASISNAIGNEIITWNSISGGMILTGDDALHPIMTVPGLYSLSVESANGCLSTDTIEIQAAEDAPIIELVHVGLLTCDDQTTDIDIAISGDYETIHWSTTNGKIDRVSSTSLSALVSQPGLYYIEAINAAGCTSNFLVEVSLADLPVADAGEDKALDCDGNAVLAVVPIAGHEYIWTSLEDVNFMIKSPSTTISRPGTYYIQVTNPLTGCTADDTIIILPGSERIEYTLEFTGCQFDEGLFFIEDSQKALVASISYGNQEYGAQDVISVGEHTQLDIHLTNGCVQIVELQYILNEPLTVVLHAPDQVFAGDPFDITAQVNRLQREILSVVWKKVDVDCAECLYQTLILDEPTDIELSILDIYGCVQQAKIRVHPKILTEVYIPTAFSPNDDGVNDKLEIFYNEHVSGIQSMKIFNRWGGSVFSVTNDEGQSLTGADFSWDGMELGEAAPSGLYIYSATLLNARGRAFEVSGSFVLLR